MNTKNNLKGYFIPSLLILITIILTSSLLHGHFRLFAMSWLWMGMGCIICLVFYNKFLSNRWILWLAVYAAIVFVNYLLGNTFLGSLPETIMEVALLFFIYAFSIIVINKEISSVNKWFVFSQLLVLLITSLLSIYVDRYSPGIIRETVSLVNMGNTAEAAPYYRLGVCEYGFPHAVPIIIPGIMVLIKNKTIKPFFRILFFGVLVIGLFLVFISGVTTSLILSLFGFLASIVIDENRSTKNVRNLIILTVFLSPLLNDNVMLRVLQTSERFIPEENKILGKIINMEESIKSESGNKSLQSREVRYQMSLEAFAKNPLLGVNDDSLIGGHSAFLDRLAAFGLLGIIPYLLFIFYFVKRLFKRIPERSRLFFFIGMAGFIIMMTAKNMSNIYVWLYSFCFLPGLLVLNNNVPRFMRKH